MLRWMLWAAAIRPIGAFGSLWERMDGYAGDALFSFDWSSLNNISPISILQNSSFKAHRLEGKAAV